jgi:LemA protein
MTTTLALILLAGIALWAVLVFNRLVRDRNQVRAAWSDIDVQLTRRHDLVPQLVRAVQAYASHERSTLEAVTEMRKRAEAATALPEKAQLEDRMAVGIERLIALAEGYPELKADGNFLKLQRDLVEVEDHLQYARRFYNGSVRVYNTHVQSVPHMLVARPCGFHVAEFFAVDAAEVRAAPRVELS